MLQKKSMLPAAYSSILVVMHLCSCCAISSGLVDSQTDVEGTGVTQLQGRRTNRSNYVAPPVPTYKPWIVYKKVRVKGVGQVRRYIEHADGKMTRIKNKVKSTLEPRPEKVHSERSLMLKGFHFCFLKWKKADVSDSFLLQRDSEWLVKDKKGRILKLCYQGDLGSINNVSYIYARAGNGRWKKFQNVSEEFRSYVARLPIDDDYGYLNHHRRKWYVMNRLGQYHKLAKRGDCHETKGSAITEQRIWHIFSYEKTYHYLQRHLEKLPKEVKDYLPSTHTLLPLGLNDPPLFNHNYHVLQRNETPLSDDQLVEQDDVFYLKRDNGQFKIELQGVGKGKLTNISQVYARAEDKTWHKFLNVSDKFRNYVRALPKQYSSRLVIYGPRNNSNWYVRDRQGMYKRLVKQGIVFRHEMHAVAEDGRYYHFLHGKLFEFLMMYVRKLPRCKTDPYPELDPEPPKFWENDIATVRYIATSAPAV